MSGRLKKIILLVLAAVLLTGSSRVQRALNRDRERLGLTHMAVLDNAPPVLAFTTVALGGFRGLIANALWIRLTELQDDDKFFEIQQLADWITKLEPHFPQVWVNAAWNMSYNISVKFKENAPGNYADRWRWVQAGIALLRDEGLKYNPDDVLIHRELGWQFQHKMGANLDDANLYYKREWLKDMSAVFGNKAANLDELIHPPTDEARARQQVLTNKYKMDPVFMKQVDELYGPLEWRLPESQAVYWGVKGLDMAKKNPTHVKAEDLIQLRRLIFQSMQVSFRRGRLMKGGFGFGPNLEIIPKTNFAYEEAMREDERSRSHIATGHRNFLKDAVYFLYQYNRIGEAAKWYQYLGEKYPDKTILDNQPNSLPRNVTLDEYCMGRIVGDFNETDADRIQAAIEGLMYQSYANLVIGESELSRGQALTANIIWKKFMDQIKGREMAIALKPLEDTQKEMVNRMLDPKDETLGLPPQMRATLRGLLNLGPETATASTNAASAQLVVPGAATNAPASTNR
ncbi:MAG: hypothetical protein EXS35_10650 [Pedosphaera sp.]|nr:hypothetical protein [Pedosphaera sp.]